MILKLGTVSQEVAKWQRFLGLTADGIFGQRTEQATKAWQAKNNIRADGIVGENSFRIAQEQGYAVPLQTSYYPPRPAFGSPSAADRAKMFGQFRWQRKNATDITILDNWAQENIVKVQIPQLIGVESAPKDGMIYFHKKGVPQLKAFFDEVEAKGLKHLIISWAGSFYPRFIRGSQNTLSNHCLPASETVWTAEGVKTVAELENYRGDVLSYKDGEVVKSKVTHFYDNGIKAILEIKGTGFSIRCTPDHKILVMRKTTLEKAEWIPHKKGRGQKRATYDVQMVEAQNLTADDYVVSLKKAEFTDGESLNEQWAEILGMFIGDGCIGHRKGKAEYVSFSIPKQDRIRDYAEKLLTDYFGEKPKTNDCALIYYNPKIVSQFASCDLKSWEKVVPSVIWKSDNRSKLAFLKGYLYTDGCVIKGTSSKVDSFSARYSFKSASLRLIQDVKFLMACLGFRVSAISEIKAMQKVIAGVIANCKTAYSFFARDAQGHFTNLADSQYQNLLDNSAALDKQTSHCYGYESVAPDFTLSKIRSIEEQPPERVFDITVEGTHNFITDGVVVSNSWGTAFDINAPQNWLGQRPAPEGTKGTLLRLVPIANKHGFYWGGHYNSRLDGMHFELAQLKSVHFSNLTESEINSPVETAFEVSKNAPKLPIEESQNEAAPQGAFSDAASPTVGSGQTSFTPPAEGNQEQPPNLGSFIPKNIPAFIPRLNWKDKLLGLLPVGGFGFTTFWAYVARMPDWLIFLLGILTGIALWNFFQFVIKHREKVLEFINTCYKVTADPTQHNLIPTQAAAFVGQRGDIIRGILSKPVNEQEGYSSSGGFW